VRYARLTALCLSLLSFGFVSAPASAESDAGIDAFVAYLDSSVRVVQSGSGARSRCRDLTVRLMELDTMARAALKGVWDSMSGQQRSAYRSAFHEKMTSECIRVTRENHAEKVTLAGVRAVSGGDRLVTTRFDSGRIVTWRVRGSGSRVKAVDVIADGRSAVLSARQEYARVLESNQGNVDALIAFMHK
jgi:ABC-type transporter MlaC component